MGFFYGTGIEILAGFGPVLATFEARFSMFLCAKFFCKDIVDCEKHFWHRMKLKEYIFFS